MLPFARGRENICWWLLCLAAMTAMSAADGTAARSELAATEFATGRDQTPLAPQAAEVVGVALNNRQWSRLCAAPTLTYLHVQSSPLCAHRCAAISAASRLEELQLIHSGVTDSALGRMQRIAGLRFLDLRGNPVTDAGLPSIAALPQLEWLDVRGTLVTTAGVAELCRMRPALRVLYDEDRTVAVR